jgi:uncharacterized cupredoxin-like copper-binding protein
VTWILRVAGLAIVAAILTTAAVALAAGGGTERPLTNATIGIHFSRFTLSSMTVEVGQPVSIVLVNHDPIEHEWIVGDEAVHERHRTGTEAYHGEIPTELTLRPYETKTTVITFTAPGDFAYICHLPGHEQYGMRGVIHVVGS